MTLVREDVVRDVKFGNSLKLEEPANSVVAGNWTLVGSAE